MALTAKEIEAIKLVGKLLRKMNISVTLVWDESQPHGGEDVLVEDRQARITAHTEPDPLHRDYTFFERLKMIEKNGVWFDRSGNKRVWPKDRKG